MREALTASRTHKPIARYYELYWEITAGISGARIRMHIAIAMHIPNIMPNEFLTVFSPSF